MNVWTELLCRRTVTGEILMISSDLCLKGPYYVAAKPLLREIDDVNIGPVAQFIRQLRYKLLLSPDAEGSP